jgi:hypothetical protein
MAAAGTFIGEIQRGWRRLLGLSWRAKAAALLVLLGAPILLILCTYSVTPLVNQPPTKHVSYSALLEGQTSEVLAPRMEDQSVDFRLLRVTEVLEADDKKRIVIAMDVRTETNYTPDLSTELGFVDRGERLSVVERTFLVAGDEVDDVDIDDDRLSIEAVFVTPASAVLTFLEVRLDGGGCSGITGCREGRFIFDP